MRRLLVGHKSKQSSIAIRNEKGAIDLSSIMVGIIVIGLIGGVIAATIFTIIPWVQDNAAKQQLDSVVAAQSAYIGLSSSSSVPAGLPLNSYANSSHLDEAGLLSEGSTYCTIRTGDGDGFLAVSLSASGRYFSVTDGQTKPVEIAAVSVPDGCNAAFPYIDKLPTTTSFTYLCDKQQSVTLPIRQGSGTVTWSDGVESSHTVKNEQTTITRTLLPNIEYKVSFVGSYKHLGPYDDWSEDRGIECLRSLDHLGSESGITDASYAFLGARNLTDVPAQMPTSIENMEGMFKHTFIFNDPDISKWDTSNVENMEQMFFQNTNFNQPLNKWNVSNVINMSSMFEGAHAFNQPLVKWDVSNVEDLSYMFANTSAFNQPLNKWDVSNVKDISGMFYGSSFNQPLNEWDTSKITNMSRLFEWHTIGYDHSLNSWDTSEVIDMSRMFYGNKTFNQPLDKWNVSKVTHMTNMFISAMAYKHDLSGWDTASLVDGTSFAETSFPQNYLPAGTSY